MTHTIFWTWQIAGAPSFKDCSEQKSLEILEYAYKKWIQTFDTAPIYWLGRSEELLWIFLKWKREKIKIITKFGFDWWEDRNTFFDFSPHGIETQLEKSLERLQTEYIDIYLLHVPENNINTTEVLTTLNSLKKHWKIKSYGVSNMYHQQLQEFLEHPLSQIEYIEDFYNILDKKAEQSIFPYMKEKHNFLAYSPLYRWVMTFQSLKNLLEKNEDAINMLIKNQDLPRIYKQKLLYEAAAKKRNISIEELALNFLKWNKKVESVILGSTNIKHLDIFLDIMKT